MSGQIPPFLPPHDQLPVSPEQRRAWLALRIFFACHVVAGVGLALYRWFVGIKYVEGEPDWRPIYVAQLFLLTVLGLLYAIEYPQTLAKIVATIGIRWTQILVVVVAVGMGIAAEFKRFTKFYYGWVEVVVGAFSSVVVVSGVSFTPVPVSKMSLPQITALVGSVYVVARGVGNIHEARDAKAPLRDQKPDKP